MKLLHIGCGPKRKDQTLPAFQSDDWQEVRFDIDESVAPDIIGTMTDMSAVETGSMGALFSSHNVEHLYPHEVPVAFGEFHRVLNDDGFAIITCPDLQSVAALVAEDKLLDPAYVSPAGPITPLDIMFGHRASMERGNKLEARNNSLYVGEDVFRIATTREAAKAVFSKSVSRVEVETHSFCNRRCNYCPNVVGDRLSQNKQMNLDHWKMILSDLAEIDFSGNFVFTSYNEPLADRSILERLAEVRAACPKARLMIYTNGDYLNATYLDEIAASGLDYLHVSIHTRHNGQYSDVDALNLIAKLERRIKRPITYKTLRPGNFVVAAMPHPSLEVEVRAINYNEHGTDRAGLVDVVKTPPARTAPCHFPFAHFHVGFSGNVTPCCHIRSDAAEHAQFLYGSLSEFGSIYEIWASQVGAAWRRELITPMPKPFPCNTCSVGFLDGKEGSRAQAEQVWTRLVAAGLLQVPSNEAVALYGNIGGAS